MLLISILLQKHTLMKAVLLALVLTSIQAAIQSKPEPGECPCTEGTKSLDCSNLKWKQIPDFDQWLGRCANTLEHISLSHNELTDMPFVMSPGEVWEYTQELEWKNGIYFANRLPMLEIVDLSHNRIGSKEARNHDLGMYLSSSKILVMDISHNGIKDMNSVGSLEFDDINEILSDDAQLILEYNLIHSLPSKKLGDKITALHLDGNPLEVDMNGHLHNEEFLPEGVDYVCWPYSVTKRKEYLTGKEDHLNLHAAMAAIDKEEKKRNRLPEEITNNVGKFLISSVPNGASCVSLKFRAITGLVDFFNPNQKGFSKFNSNCHRVIREKKKDPINREKKKGLRKGCCDTASSSLLGCCDRVSSRFFSKSTQVIRPPT